MNEMQEWLQSLSFDLSDSGKLLAFADFLADKGDAREYGVRKLAKGMHLVGDWHAVRRHHLRLWFEGFPEAGPPIYSGMISSGTSYKHPGASGGIVTGSEIAPGLASGSWLRSEYWGPSKSTDSFNLYVVPPTEISPTTSGFPNIQEQPEKEPLASKALNIAKNVKWWLTGK